MLYIFFIKYFVFTMQFSNLSTQHSSAQSWQLGHCDEVWGVLAVDN